MLNNDKRKKKRHDSRIGTFSFKMEAEMTMESANEFIGSIVMEKGANIYRMKGFLAIQGCKEKFVFHSVGMLFSCVPFKDWEPEETRECVLVIIGKHLEDKWIRGKFMGAAITPPKELEEIKGADHDHSHSHSDEDSHSHSDDYEDEVDVDAEKEAKKKKPEEKKPAVKEPEE